MKRSSPLIPVNPFDARARADPYPVYLYMRTVEPIYRSPLGFWLITRYADCSAILEDPSWSHSADRILEPGRGEGQPVDPTVRLLRASVLFTDGQVLASRRRVLEPLFKQLVRGMDARVARTARGLISIMKGKSAEADLMHDYVGPIAIVTIADLMGVNVKDRLAMDQLGRDLAMGLDPSVGGRRVARADAAAAAIVEFFLDQIDASRSGARRGLIAQLVERQGKQRTFELVADLVAIFVTGVQTTAGLIGNSVLALLRNPDRFRELNERPALMSTAIEELARYDAPIHLTARVAESAVAIGSVAIGAGEQVLLLLGAANRDPARFAEPDRLDLGRSDNPHLAFGAGAHSCFARPLATGIASTAIRILGTELPDLSLAGDPDWAPTVTLRVLSSLPVVIGK